MPPAKKDASYRWTECSTRGGTAVALTDNPVKDFFVRTTRALTRQQTAEDNVLIMAANHLLAQEMLETKQLDGYTNKWTGTGTREISRNGELLFSLNTAGNSNDGSVFYMNHQTSKYDLFELKPSIWKQVKLPK